MTMGSPTFSAPAQFSLGLGLTNECNLSCSFCYRDPSRTDRLQREDVDSVMDALPIRSVNLGTGENGMHPEFKSMLASLRERASKLTITSNGHSIEVLDDDDLSAFADVEFSLDYPTREEQDAQRGAGNWELVQQQAARCRRLGVGVTIVAVVMKSNFDRLAEIAEVAKAFDAPLRLNVYQAVRTDAFALTYDEYWTAFEKLFAQTDVIAIGESLVRAMAGLPPRLGGCGVSTVRVTPRGTVQPCVYWPGGGAPLAALLAAGPSHRRQRAVRASALGSRSLRGLRACRCVRRRLLRAGGGCSANSMRPIPIARSSARTTRRFRSAWRQRGIFQNSESACTTIVVAR